MQLKPLAGMLLGLGFILLYPAYAQTNRTNGDTWTLCPFEPPPSVPHYPDDLVHILADHAFLNPHGDSQLTGHVQLTRGNQTLLSGALLFNNDSQLAASQGPLTLESPNLSIVGKKGFYNLRNQKGTLQAANYHFYPMHAHGRADQINRLGPSQTSLNHATYSTCPVGHRAWILSASAVHLDETRERGTAHDVLIRFKGIPILYTPYISFPLSNRRKSGLLPPIIGQSTKAGFEYRQPVYWNIAPQADATITPEIFSKRGFGLGTQLRYLGTHSASELDANVLPHDSIYGGSRYLLSLHQHAAPLPGLSDNIAYNRVSDPNYFNDLGTTLQNLDTTYLGQSADVTYQREYWTLSTLAQRYQVLNPALTSTASPYEILPQIDLNARLPYTPAGLNLTFYSQWDRFVRAASVTGNRLDLMPRISLPLRGPAWFLTPAVAYRYTGYQLQHELTGTSPDPTRSLPIASLDGGLYFERAAGAKTLQTVEPRLFYLYVPYRNQQALPIFDTTAFPLTFSQLFNDNRFVGADRVSNANQLTAAVTTRFINTETGSELLQASLGQIFYFKPQMVTLPGQAADTSRRSDYVSQLGLAISQHWWANAGLNFNSTTHDIDTASFNTQYRLSKDQLIALGYQYYRHEYDQTSLSLAWPLTRHWQLATSWSYSLQSKRLLQGFAGVQYDSCCWAFRMLAQRYLSTLNDSYNNGIFFELVLKGLGHLGTPIGTYLKRNIPDYVPPA